MALFEETTNQTKKVIDPNVDFKTETVEGRIGNLLATDDKGNYTNEVVRQAQDRQAQAFNARGLLNTNLAMQAGQEAAISKASEIAAPDAKTYYDNRRSNMEQSFQTRKSYQDALQTIGTNFQRQLDTINSSNMTPDDKNVAIQQAQAARDGEITFQNNLYSKMPLWQQEWLAPSIATGGMEFDKVSNRDTLSTIVNDPAQTKETRDAAAARMKALDGGATTAAGGMIGGGATVRTAGVSSVNGEAFPAAIGGAQVNWDGPPVGGIRIPGQTLRSQYEKYAQQAGPYAMTPYEWYMQQAGGRSMIGGLYDNAGPGNEGSAGVGAASAGDSGIGGGMSA